MLRAYTKSGSIEKYEGGLTVSISNSSVTKPTITPDASGNYSWPSITNYTYQSNATSGDIYITTNYNGVSCKAYYKKNGKPWYLIIKINTVYLEEGITGTYILTTTGYFPKTSDSPLKFPSIFIDSNSKFNLSITYSTYKPDINDFTITVSDGPGSTTSVIGDNFLIWCGYQEKNTGTYTRYKWKSVNFTYEILDNYR